MTLAPAPAPLILASASPARRQMLEGAGLAVTAQPADVDEISIKENAQSDGQTPGETAQSLAIAKALAVSATKPSALVIGADQMLACGDVWFDKPLNRAGAMATLMALSGRDHTLHSAVAVAQDGAVLWDHIETATLSMRPLDVAFIDAYLTACGDDIFAAVGAYHLEGRGAQLFTKVDGDYFTVLGLPLLAVLEFLRSRGMGMV